MTKALSKKRAAERLLRAARRFMRLRAKVFTKAYTLAWEEFLSAAKADREARK